MLYIHVIYVYMYGQEFERIYKINTFNYKYNNITIIYIIKVDKCHNTYEIRLEKIRKIFVKKYLQIVLLIHMYVDLNYVHAIIIKLIRYTIILLNNSH